MAPEFVKLPLKDALYAPGHVLVDQSSTCDLLELRERGTQASHQSLVNATWVVEIAEPATSGRASRRAYGAVSDCMSRYKSAELGTG